jgi:hypothetical protein
VENLVKRHINKRPFINISTTNTGYCSGVARNFFSGGGGGVQQIQLRTEGRENGDLWVVAP